ncbi:aspartate/glutamate racemase family protein [Loigolactobacillus coryniformis]|jgi:aspartate racemase|nr:amino acid racemase [Loigolactobacillus coryniformis]MBW4801369.1 amino acid racemase [Loigolactobacillus coryniformis subsp. torquens]MBW4804071.1 amino acid racemase [Loigolactobacillus coryniformis subsp. torquens]
MKDREQMQKVGIIGGLGPEATMMYYRAIISQFQQHQGNQTTLPELMINSVNMYQMFAWLEKEDYTAVANYLSQAAQQLAAAGADFVVMCGITPHIVFEQIQQPVPLLSMVTASCQHAQKLGLKKLGLLGTEFTMQHDFFKRAFRDAGIEVITPNSQQQQFIHHKIVTELENGIVKPATRQDFLAIIKQLQFEQQIDGVVLGCTELPLLLKTTDVALPLLDPAAIHIAAIVAQIFS